MPNLDPFLITPGGILKDLQLFVGSIGSGDAIDPAQVSVVTGDASLTIDNFSVNLNPELNEYGVSYPAGHVLHFDLACSGLADFERVNPQFTYVTENGEQLTLTYPVQLKPAGILIE